MVTINKKNILKTSKDKRLQQKENARLHREWLLKKIRKDVTMNVAQRGTTKGGNNEII
tara:strand:- start:384 stop:557 length:174 start_codon:yes stop_codon:yes gene_type:complete